MSKLSGMSPTDYIRSANAKSVGKVAKNFMSEASIEELREETFDKNSLEGGNKASEISNVVQTVVEKLKLVFGIKSEKSSNGQDKDYEPFGNAMNTDEFGNADLDSQRKISSKYLTHEEKQARLKKLRDFSFTLNEHQSEK